MDVVEEYTTAALAGDRAAAADIAAEFAGVDGSSRRVIHDLFAPSQRIIGERWQHQLCTVGQEHAATFVTESVLSSIAVGLEPAPTKGTLVMVCAEGEWHGLPARMATELLISDGWRVFHLGPSTPAPALRTYLAGIDADVVGVSVTLPANLTGAARTVRVARQLGFPVIAGGAAFTGHGHRARAIGANGLVADLEGDVDLGALNDDDTPLPDIEGDWARIEFDRVRIVRDALRRFGGGRDDVLDPSGSAASWLEHLAAELDDIVVHVAAAMLCDDVTIIDEFHAWYDDRLAALGTPRAASAAAFAAVADAVEQLVPGASVYLAA